MQPQGISFSSRTDSTARCRLREKVPKFASGISPYEYAPRMAIISKQFLEQLRLKREGVPSFDEYPFCLDAVRGLDTLKIDIVLAQGQIAAEEGQVLLDPPRSGAQSVLAHLPALGVQQILYVSCYPATLARDAGILVHEHGYQLHRAGVIDMFPHTAHVESMALFTR